MLAVLASVVIVAEHDEPVFAASITVNTAVDIPADPATGRYPTDGLCSLRAAISSAQNNSNAHDVDCATGAPVPGVLDTITIAPSLAGSTLTIGGGFDAIYGPDNPLMIVGPTTNAADFVISGANAHRPFVVGIASAQSGVLTLANLTVANGYYYDRGGALYAAQGSQLTFDNVVFRDNVSWYGGAVFANSSTITNNGGAYINNQGYSVGGAIFLEEGPSILNGYAMLLEGNSSFDKGGAIASNPGSANPFIHIERSLMRDNTAAGFGTAAGGVVYIEPVGAPTAVTVEITDSTLVENSSVFASTATTQRFNFERNTFVDTGELFTGTGGGTLRNSIITGTTSCRFSANVANFVGTRNLMPAFEDPGDCGVRGLNPLGAVTGLSPTLAQNGGPEVQQTFALLAGSNAIDNGAAAFCGTIDARSVQRGIDGDGTPDSPQPGDCDIGAYEYADYVVNFVTGTSSVNEAAGFVDIPVRLKILNAATPALPSALSIGVINHPTSTAVPGAAGDFTLAGNSVTFPAGSRDGAIANLRGQHQPGRRRRAVRRARPTRSAACAGRGHRRAAASQPVDPGRRPGWCRRRRRWERHDGRRGDGSDR